MRIQIKSLSRADRFKCKFGIFNLLLRFEDRYIKIKRGSLSAINNLRFYPRLNSNLDCLATIGDFCEFAETKILLGGEHPRSIVHSTFGTSYEILLTQTGTEFMPTTAGPIDIGPCCVFGVNTTVLSGTKVGQHSTIGAGALISSSYPENSVLVGLPARRISARLSDSEYKFLQKYPWWTACYDWIIKSIKSIQNGETPHEIFLATQMLIHT